MVRRDVNLGQLADEITARVGRAVVLTVDRAAGDDPDVLVVTDAADGAPVDLPPVEVTATVTAHTPAPPEPVPVDGLVEALEAATTLPGLRAALLGYARAEQARTPRPRRRGSR